MLHLIGTPGGKPVPPLNLVGDFGGGGMLLAFGVLAACSSPASRDEGQVVDAAMVDGSAALLAMFYGMRARGMFQDATGTNFLAGARRSTTRTHRDHKYIADRRARAAVLRAAPRQARAGLAALQARRLSGRRSGDEGVGRAALAIAAAVASRTRDEWCRIMEGTDACFAPVLTVEEAASIRTTSLAKPS